MTARKGDHWVVCPDYAAGPFASPESAQSALDGIVRLDACHQPHAIVRQATKPEIRQPWRTRRAFR